MVDAVQLVGQEHFPEVKTKKFALMDDSENAIQRPDVDRVVRIHCQERMNPKAQYRTRFPGYNPPSAHFNPAVEIQDAFFKDPERFTQESPSNQKLFGNRLLRFMTRVVLPMVRKHGSVYLKDAEGGGGGNLVRLRERMGHLVLETTNPRLWRSVRHAQITLRASKARKASTRRALWNRGRKAASEEGNEPPTAVSLGRLERVNSDMLSALSEDVANILLNKPGGSNQMVAEAQIPHLKSGGHTGNPVEYRLFLQRQIDGTYRVVHHYAKIGGRRIASNIGQGGHVAPSTPTLTEILRKAGIGKNASARKRMAADFFSQGIRMAEKLVNEEEVYKSPVTVAASEVPPEISGLLEELGSTISIAPTEKPVITVRAPPDSFHRRRGGHA